MQQPYFPSRMAIVMLLSAGALTLGGCSTAGKVVMAPVHAASWTVDKMTTSQSEADRNRGRRMRKQEEREARACHRDARYCQSSPDYPADGTNRSIASTSGATAASSSER